MPIDVDDEAKWWMWL